MLYRRGSFAQATSTLPNVAVFSGSFNPLHDGHRELRIAAERILQREVVFEISISNVEKSDPDEMDIGKRLSQFEHSVVLTNAPLFLQKAALFPACCFVVGFDTAARIVDSRFYDGSDKKMHHCLNQLAAAGHSFLVGGRADTAGCFLGVESLHMPSEFYDLFRAIPESIFRQDISSTSLRNTTIERQD